MRNEERLKGNPRLAMPYRTLARMDAGRRAAIAADARRFLDALDAPDRGPDQLALEI
jgi:deoxyribodipyrimidine photolyase-related protein